MRRVLEDSFIIARDENGRGARAVQHVPAPRHAGLPRRDGQRVALPLPVPRLVLPQRRPAGRAAVPPDAYGGEAGFRAQGPDAAAGTVAGHLQRADLHQPRPGRAAAAGVPRRLRVLPRLLHAAEPGAASSCAARSAGGSRRTGRSAPRTSPATCTTRRRPTRASWRSACSASRRPRSARTGAPTGPAAAAGRPTSCRRATLDERLRYVGYPDEMIERMKRAVVARSSSESSARDGFMISAASVFPNLSFVHNWPQGRGLRRRGAAVHLAPPVAAGLGRTRPRCCRGSRSTQRRRSDFKELSYKAYLMCFGSTGMFEQDDVENWVSLTSTAAGSMARRLLLNSRMGLLADDTTGRRCADRRRVRRSGRRPTSATASTTSARCCRPVGRLPRRRPVGRSPGSRPGGVS